MKTRKVKICWVSRQFKDGWGLFLAAGNNDFHFRKKLRMYNVRDVEKILRANIVFVHRRVEPEKYI